MKQPKLRFNNLHPHRTTPQVPQNLLRVTNKGCPSCGPSSTMMEAGMNGLAGIGAMSPLGRLGQVYTNGQLSPGWLRFLGLVSLAGGVLGAYHGYKRHDSIWGGIGWYFLGSFFWPIAIPVAFGQGFAKRKR